MGDSTRNERLRNEQEYDILCKAEQFVLTHSGLAGFRDMDSKKRIILRQQEIDEANQRRKEKEAQKLKAKKLMEQTSPAKEDKQLNGKVNQTPDPKATDPNKGQKI